MHCTRLSIEENCVVIAHKSVDLSLVPRHPTDAPYNLVDEILRTEHGVEKHATEEVCVVVEVQEVAATSSQKRERSHVAVVKEREPAAEAICVLEEEIISCIEWRIDVGGLDRIRK